MLLSLSFNYFAPTILLINAALLSPQRNLKDMVRMGLSAKQEKDDKFQLIKREVSEMIKMRVASPMYKVLS